MKLFRRILSYTLVLAMLLSVVPATALADDEEKIYTVSNDYVKFSFNGKTGGFSLETLEGHPKKILDDNIPLLYAEDEERSNGTSFVSVRIYDGDKYDDYVFGQDYGFFGLDSELLTPTVSESGRLVEIPWRIKEVTVTMRAALDNQSDDLTGNVGLEFKVETSSDTPKKVGVRLLLDTALGERVDAPYFVVDKDANATMTETELSGENLPGQVRALDSLTNPTRLAYLITKGWSNSDVKSSEPDRVILGHWANLANTRYDYEPNPYCDFTNYSNEYRAPDSAAAVYWDQKTVTSEEPFSGQLLYGVGSFSNTDSALDINVTVHNRVELENDGKSYKSNASKNDDGKNIYATVTLDNANDESVELTNVSVSVSADSGKLNVKKGAAAYATFEKGNTDSFEVVLEAVEQSDLTAGTFYITVSGQFLDENGVAQDFETAAERSVILPGTGEISKMQLNNISPKTVFTEGEKVITVSGKMSTAFTNKAADVSLYLVNEEADHTVPIDKDKMAFLDENCTTLTFSTDEELIVGEYSVVFEINDKTIAEQVGGDKIECKEKLEVSADEKYRVRSYGMIALIRTMDKNSRVGYDFFTFDTENEFTEFYHGNGTKTGRYNNTEIKNYNFAKNEDAIGKNEILLTVRGRLNQATDDNKNLYWQADYANGDIIINNMLSYEGDKPLTVKKSGDNYSVEGDGLIKVIDSINVWRYKWSINVEKDDSTVYTLNSEAYKKSQYGEELSNGTASTGAVTLKLGGAASLVQTLGGFAVSLKYGEFSSEFHKGEENSDGTITYGIGFGGKISLPIKAKKKESDSSSEGEGAASAENSTANETAEERMSDSDVTAALDGIFGTYEVMQWEESRRQSGDITTGSTGSTGGSAGSGGASASGNSIEQSSLSEAAWQSSDYEVMKKDDDLDDGSLTAEVENVLFGEKYNDKEYKVDSTGFVGINATLSLELPEDVLGSLVSNAPGIEASVTINTIDNVYEVQAGLSLKIIECEGVLAFKQVELKGKDVILPDKIEFYIRDGLKIPLAPPVLFMTGLGGGINELADTIGGEFDALPPITILLYTKLEAINVLEGEFNAKINLEELTLTGDMHLSYKGMEKVMQLNAGIHARWIEPWELSLYGDVSIVDGIIRGGISVIIADNYFYGYVYASIYVPDSIPLVGGKELAGVEAAVSHEFIGANVKIIGIKFGVKYYWGDKVSFGSNIDLSAPPRNDQSTPSYMASDNSSAYAIGYYGTNVYALPTSVRAVTSAADTETVTVSLNAAKGKNALLLEIPYEGTAPTAENLALYNPSGDEIALCTDEASDDCNMLVQSRTDGDYIYITVTESDKIINGDWKLEYDKTAGFEITSFNVSAVDDIPELDKDKATIAEFNVTDKNNMTVNVGWSVTGAKGKSGTIDVYLTEDKDILEKIQTGNNTGDILGTNILHKEYTDLSNASSEKIKLPGSLPNGKYYAVVTLSTDEGISLAISPVAQSFTNPNLPNAVSGVEIAYGGNGQIFVKVTDNADADYTHYIAQIVAEDGTVLENNVGQFEKGKNFTFGKEALLKAGKSYHIEIKTLREEYARDDSGAYKTHYYYQSGASVSSNTLKMPEAQPPELESVKVYDAVTGKTIDLSQNEINIDFDDVIVEYTFKDDVFVEMDLNGGKVYSYGTAENIEGYRNKTFDGFKKKWKFVLDDLEDGDYVVDFFAFNRQKDNIKGRTVDNGSNNAYFAFTIDTSAPILSLSQSSATSLTNKALVFGANTVLADDNGKYTISGITEKSATVKIDGALVDDGAIAHNGSFSIEKTLGENESFTSHTVSAEDKAGNVSEITVWAVRANGFVYDGLELEADGMIRENNQKVLKLRNGQTVKLTAYAVSGASKIAVDSANIDWSVLYAKNAVSVSDGEVTAVSPEESAVKAKLATANVINGKTERTDGLSDYVIIEIENNNRDDLAEKINEAETLLSSNSDASEAKRNALNTVIEAAKNVLSSQGSTGQDYTDAYDSLTNAMEAFKRTEQGGSGSSGGGGSKTYTASASNTEHGTVKLSQTKVTRGNSLTITAIPDEGYTVADMLINGVSVGRADTYTISSVTENIVVTVVFAEKSDELPFDDVIKSDWYYDFIKTAYERGYMNGTSDNKFEPELTLTRAMFVTVLHRIDGGESIGENIFDDVADDAYYARAVAWANANGIVLGVSDREFAPDLSITREQMATMLYRYAKYKGFDTSAGENTNILSYEDYAEISDYAISAMQYTAGTGLMTGRSESTLNPLSTATRAEAATVFVRFADMVK